MVLLGAVIPFLIVIKVLESTYLLNFFAFGASVIGLFFGVLGTSGLFAERKQKSNWMSEDWHNSDQE